MACTEGQVLFALLVCGISGGHVQPVCLPSIVSQRTTQLMQSVGTWDLWDAAGHTPYTHKHMLVFGYIVVARHPSILIVSRHFCFLLICYLACHCVERGSYLWPLVAFSFPPPLSLACPLVTLIFG